MALGFMSEVSARMNLFAVVLVQVAVVTHHATVEIAWVGLRGSSTGDSDLLAASEGCCYQIMIK
jgi:hypothetical protein